MTRVAIVFMLLCGLIALLGAAPARSEENGQYREILVPESGQLLVVEESVLQPRSVGSIVALRRVVRSPR